MTCAARSLSLLVLAPCLGIWDQLRALHVGRAVQQIIREQYARDLIRRARLRGGGNYLALPWVKSEPECHGRMAAIRCTGALLKEGVFLFAEGWPTRV